MRSILITILMISMALAAMPGCDSSSGGGDSTDAGMDAGDDGPDYAYPIEGYEIAWEPCSFIWGEDDGEAECAITDLPLFWDDPDNGKTIPVAVKRRLSEEAQSEGQMWFLHGGPGASGVEGLPPLMRKIQDLYPELDVYTIDHRGVGDSDKLVCPGEDDPYDDHLPECLEYLDEEFGDDLHGYSTSGSAIDLAAYIEATREEGKKVLIWGGSYGTYLSHRYLEIFPEQSDGVVLEGIAPADSTFIRTGEEFDKAGRELFARCGQDDYCAAKMGKSPLALVQHAFDRIYSHHHCTAMGDYQYYIPYVMTSLLYYHPYHAALPAIAYRLNRCESQDVGALYNLLNMVYGEESTYQDLGEGYSSTLYNNVVYSEMWEHPDWPDEESLLDYFQEIEEQAIFNTGSGEYMYDVFKVWPRYDDSEWDDKWAETDTPLLMLQGMLDPATGYDSAVTLTEHFDGPTQTFVAFPTAPHNVTSGTPVSTDPDEISCGRQLMVDFLKDPQAELDLSCMDDVLPINFEGDAELAELVFGSPHLWDNSESYSKSSSGASTGIRGEWMDALKEIRRRARADARRLRGILPPLEDLPAGTVCAASDSAK